MSVTAIFGRLPIVALLFVSAKELSRSSRRGVPCLAFPASHQRTCQRKRGLAHRTATYVAMHDFVSLHREPHTPTRGFLVGRARLVIVVDVVAFLVLFPSAPETPFGWRQGYSAGFL